jgi:hypothetical protein
MGTSGIKKQYFQYCIWSTIQKLFLVQTKNYNTVRNRGAEDDSLRLYYNQCRNSLHCANWKPRNPKVLKFKKLKHDAQLCTNGKKKQAFYRHA